MCLYVCYFLTSRSSAFISCQVQVELTVIYTRRSVAKPVIYSFFRAEDKLFRCVRDNPLHVVNSVDREKRTLHKCGGS